MVSQHCPGDLQSEVSEWVLYTSASSSSATARRIDSHLWHGQAGRQAGRPADRPTDILSEQISPLTRMNVALARTTLWMDRSQ